MGASLEMPLTSGHGCLFFHCLKIPKAVTLGSGVAWRAVMIYHSTTLRASTRPWFRTCFRGRARGKPRGGIQFLRRAVVPVCHSFAIRSASTPPCLATLHDHLKCHWPLCLRMQQSPPLPDRLFTEAKLPALGYPPFSFCRCCSRGWSEFRCTEVISVVQASPTEYMEFSLARFWVTHQ